MRHLIRVIRGHGLIHKKKMTKRNTKTMTKDKYINEHIQRAFLDTYVPMTFETLDQSDEDT